MKIPKLYFWECFTIYYRYSDFLKNKYGEKVYKLPVSIPCTCPNRDGKISTGGCIFCGDIATGFEMYSSEIEVRKQISMNVQRIGTAYGAKKFIAYFQNFTNTYINIDKLRNYLEESLCDGIVQIALSTRPDCINIEVLDMLKVFSEKNNIDISIELGLQTVNFHTLKKINRGHTLAEFIDAILMIKNYGFETGVHVILNLPWDSYDDSIETAKILSALKIDTVKLHSLYILKNSDMGRMYEDNKFEIRSKDEYIERVISFIRYLDPNIAIQRLLARAPEGDSLFCNWGTSWWKIKDEIELIMKNNNFAQGDLFNYLGGSALK